MPLPIDIGRAIHVLVATPAGAAGQGGIDRIMAALKGELARTPQPDICIRFLATRGDGALALSFMHLLWFCTVMMTARLRGRLDVVHINLASHGSTYRKLVITALAGILRVPYVLHLHGAEYRTFWSARDSFINRRIRTMFSKAARVIVLGSPWEAFVSERVPEASARVVIIANSVAPPCLPHVGGGDSIHILFLGRIEKRKGIPQLVQALALMRDRDGWRATIAGDGAVEELRSDLAGLGLSHRVEVPGWCGPGEVARLLANSDILTLPSHAENLPMSVIEAMACGLGIVATPVGAVADIIIHEETGILVAPGDDRDLAQALIRMVEDHDLRRRLGVAAQALQQERLAIAPYAVEIGSIWRAAAEGSGSGE